jgi:hypothetical protein
MQPVPDAALRPDPLVQLALCEALDSAPCTGALVAVSAERKRSTP